MSIGIVTEDDLQRELESLNGSHKKRVPSVVVMERPGRDKGDNNVPDSLRKIIGEESVINGRSSALQIAKQFGISPSSVSAYANGSASTTTYDSPKPSIIQHINKSRERASKKAGKVLASALQAITQEKLDYTDARDLSGIAKDMSVIIKNLEPPSSDPTTTNNQPQFTIYAPQFRDERSFEVITVQE
jgi:predicted transcriptional regulator